MSIVELIASNGYISVNKSLIKRYGLEAAVLLGELASEAEYWNQQEKENDGWFFSTVDNVEKNTGLSVYVQRKAMEVLQKSGIIEVKLKGIPARRYVYINKGSLLEDINNKMCKNSTASGVVFEALAVEKVDGNKNKNKNNVIIKRKHTKEKVSSMDDMFGLDDGTPEELPEDVKPETCYSFDEFWEDYGKKVGRVNAEQKFKRISEKDRAVIKEKLPEYIAATPDKAFRKNPCTYLNGKCWNDEIVTRDEINRSRFTKHEQTFYGSYGRYQPVKHN